MESGKSAPEKDSLLLVTAVALRKRDGRYFIDDQTWHGLAQWLRYFETVTYAGLDAEGSPDESSVNWLPVTDVPGSERLKILVMPRAYRPLTFARTYRETRRRLAKAIAANERLCFTIGHLIGDWGSVAALEAHAQDRPYGVWYDRVEYDVIRRSWSSLRWRARIREALSIPIAQALQKVIIRRSTMGLYQGGDCYEHFKPMAPMPFCVYDTHTTEGDFIPADRLKAKIAEVGDGAPLRICYAGRAAAMKGPQDWLRVLGMLRDAGVRFQAMWLGDGPLLGEMQQLRRDLDLSGSVELPGFVGDRNHLVEHLRRAHVFMFCHKTPESPRCLIEALVSGSAIVGYDSAYARDLLRQEGGGCLTPINDIAALAGKLVEFDRDRAGLADLIMRSGREGRRFDEDTVYRHRAMLMREHLPALA
ncbi:MAG: glycosyltransferase [Burkholderiales bacterium]|jgi:glycosyltransferase involved in cell wall biosynthesis|nr:glycosyltransferase [Burkholderiales bacterium]